MRPLSIARLNLRWSHYFHLDVSRKQFTVSYPDRSKRNISRSQRDTLLLSRQIAHASGLEYRFIGLSQTLHSFADLSQLLGQPLGDLRHHLDGQFIFVDTLGRRHRELLETPEALALRLGLA